MQRAVCRNVFFRFAGGRKTVREDLIQNAARKPVRRFICTVVHGQLPVFTCTGARLAAEVLFKDRAPTRCAQLKMIEVKPRFLRRKVALPPLIVIAVHAAPEHIKALNAVIRVLHQKVGGRALHVARQRNFKVHTRAVCHSAQRAAVYGISGIK